MHTFKLSTNILLEHEKKIIMSDVNIDDTDYYMNLQSMVAILCSLVHSTGAIDSENLDHVHAGLDIRCLHL